MRVVVIQGWKHGHQVDPIDFFSAIRSSLASGLQAAHEKLNDFAANGELTLAVEEEEQINALMREMAVLGLPCLVAEER